jgi:catechol 2,3-dioxygenase-like lactoylglutathione lyase family enzyme
VGVDDLGQSIAFYSSLFGAEPVKSEADYAKWMLEDPPVNFAISSRGGNTGVDHLGLQVDDEEELEALRDRLQSAKLSVFDEGETVCCYARSNKSWVEDPSGVAWEAYHTMEDAQLFSAPPAAADKPIAGASSSAACCEPRLQARGCCS